ENILVVSPYNMQVNHLKSILPSGARVGTVDKFQGQEAEVVLISMATSSGEDLPRNIEFLFSKNRLNVAISRARCLAVIVASPALLEIPCRTVEELELVNTLCHAREYGDVLGFSKLARICLYRPVSVALHHTHQLGRRTVQYYNDNAPDSCCRRRPP